MVIEPARDDHLATLGILIVQQAIRRALKAAASGLSLTMRPSPCQATSRPDHSLLASQRRFPRFTDGVFETDRDAHRALQPAVALLIDAQHYAELENR